LEQAEKLAMICNLDHSLAAKFQKLEAAEPIPEGLSKQIAAPHQENAELEE